MSNRNRKQNPFVSLILGLAIVSASAGTIRAADWKMAAGPLQTRWAKDVSPTNALKEYPRPQLARDKWMNLNGLWSYGVSDLSTSAAPSDMGGQILVPFPYESALSGVGKASIPDKKLWYRRTFAVPADWSGQKVLLHFGAVTWEAQVWVNGKELGSHKGGWDGFSFDVTDALKPGDNEIVVSANNPLKADVADAQSLGKQRVHSGGIWYTGATGIWQTVWLEPVPVAAHIDTLQITPDLDAGGLRILVNSAGGTELTVELSDGGKVISTTKGMPNGELTIPVPNAILWTPEVPHLYDLKVTLGEDTVKTYAGMRKISLGKDDKGRTTILLNNKPYFQVGALDQGYWPDGIYTAPTDEALKFDIEASKKLGWNLLRKHAKVEPARWYYWADKLGVLVWQDMPSMFGPDGDRQNVGNLIADSAKKEYDAEWERIMTQFHNFPSIVVWTTFNEGWGQHDTAKVVETTKKRDPSRLVNNASGWTDKNCGDIHDTHAYPVPNSTLPEDTRAAVCGEYGGVTVDLGHRWSATPVMGYGSTLKSSYIATKRFQGLMKRAYELKEEKGTCAFVYTQVTDVEQEINGLYTYDRELVKMDEKIVAAANRGEFLPLPPNPTPALVPTAEDEAVQWSYTTTKPAAGWEKPGDKAGSWKTGPAPFGHDYSERTPWQTPDLWIRRTMMIDAKVPDKLYILIRHDEDAEVYINGVLATKVTGFTGSYKAIEMTKEARAALKPGAENTIAAHVHQTIGGQGIDVGITAYPQ